VRSPFYSHKKAISLGIAGSYRFFLTLAEIPVWFFRSELVISSLFYNSRQRIFETLSLRGEAFELSYENYMKKGSAFIFSPE
jgi:hypothetical protein